MSAEFHTDATDEPTWFRDLAKHIAADLKATGAIPKHMPTDQPAVNNADTLVAALAAWQLAAEMNRGFEDVMYPAPFDPHVLVGDA
jgi:hypothetical protein